VLLHCSIIDLFSELKVSQCIAHSLGQKSVIQSKESSDSFFITIGFTISLMLDYRPSFNQLTVAIYYYFLVIMLKKGYANNN